MIGEGGCTFGPVYKGSEHLEQYSSNFLLGEGHKQFVDGHFKRAAENYCMLPIREMKAPITFVQLRP